MDSTGIKHRSTSSSIPPPTTETANSHADQELGASVDSASKTVKAKALSPDADSIFLQSCKPAWHAFPRDVHLCIRSLMTSYLLLTGLLIFADRIRRQHMPESDSKESTVFDKSSNWRYVFSLSALSYVLSYLYHAIVTTWTFMHITNPARKFRKGFKGKIQRFFSPPHTTSLRAQYRFSIFYTTVHVVAFLNTIMYWYATIPHKWRQLCAKEGRLCDGSPDDMFAHEDRLAQSARIHLNTTPAIISIIEILFLNSIRLPKGVHSHELAMLFFAVLHVVWAKLGQRLVGYTAYFWVSLEESGSWQNVFGYTIAFFFISPVLYSAMFTVMAGRDFAARWYRNMVKDSE